jgi:hypothetical protein
MESLLEGMVKFDKLRIAASNIRKQDEQSADLFEEVYSELYSLLKMKPNVNEALGRFLNIADNTTRWDPALIRNNVFKAAHALGMKLPSYMFASTKEAVIMSEIDDLVAKTKGR